MNRRAESQKKDLWCRSAGEHGPRGDAESGVSVFPEKISGVCFFEQTPLPTLSGVRDGARTHDNRNHNPGLYQLSYGQKFLPADKPKFWSGWRDSNSRHPAPKAGALPDYATPR